MTDASTSSDARRFVLTVGLCVLTLAWSTLAAASGRPNILFVSVDDLRPELGCYGNDEIRSPHLDQFAKRGTAFTHAYCQAAVCAPSRASVMTGLRPDSTRVWDLRGKFRENLPDVVTIPQHFHAHGYHTVSMGKIFHNHMPDRVSFDEPDLRPAKYMTPELIDREPESFYHDEGLNQELYQVRQHRLNKNPNAYADGWAYGRSTESFDAPDNEFYDGAQTDLAIETLARLKDSKQPFFLALGYYRPHLPFVAPKKYWDLYDRDMLSMASNPFLPKGAPVMAMNSAYELKGCYDLEHVKHPATASLTEKEARLLKHGYYASVSFVDACFGKLMRGLADLGLDNNTIVVVWGDHGWKLGEHGSWCKQTNYDIDLRVPLIVHVPGQTSDGVPCNKLVELVDLYPTLCDAAGIEIPAKLEGTSFLPLLADPSMKWKSAAFSQFHRSPRVTPDGGRYMGLSVVTHRYHFVEWRNWDHVKGVAGELVATELYDRQSDPDENTNISGSESNTQIVNNLSQRLRRGWRWAQPPR
jgi:iduronate 2-sulfatase